MPYIKKTIRLQTLRIAFVGLLTATSAAALNGVAAGQDALGGGNALDANLNPNSRINPTIRSRTQQYQQYQARNRLITGDVAGGRGFRGSVGYSAVGDFRGTLGSDDLFQFRAGSATSSLSFVQSGLSRQYLQLGASLNAFEYRRSASAITSGDIGQQRQRITPSLHNAERRFEHEALSRMLQGDVERIGQPSTIGFLRTEQGQPVPVTASPLRGIMANPLQPGLDQSGLSTFDLSQLREDMQSGFAFPTIGEPFPVAFQDQIDGAVDGADDDADADMTLQPGPQPDAPRPQPGDQSAADRLPWTDNRQQSATERNRVQTQRTVQTPADYQRILKNITERYANREGVDLSIDPQLIRGLGEEFTELRNELRRQSLQRGTIGEEAGDADEDEFNDPQQQPDGDEEIGTERRSLQRGDAQLSPEEFLEQRLGQALRTRETTRRPSEVQGIDSPFREMSQRALERRREESRQRVGLRAEQYTDLLAHGQRVEKLSGDTEDWLNELISRGEAALRSGEYFNAEQRFNRALRMTRNHPTALAGKAHAQLGAGLHLSSALTLRALFTDRPEMIDAQYAENLLPSQQRLQAAINTIRGRLTDDVEPASNGLLLAYIGRQTDNRALMQEGLSAIESSNPDDPLLPLLQGIWLQGKSADDAVTGPAAPADPEEPDSDDDGLAEPGK